VKSVATTFPEYNKHFNKTPYEFQQLYEAENPTLRHAEESKAKYYYFLHFPVTYVKYKTMPHTVTHGLISTTTPVRIGVREKHHILCDGVRNKHEITE